MATLLDNLGIFRDILDLFLPFLLVFAVLYALFQKSKMLSESQNVNSVISFAIAMIVVLSGAGKFISKITPGRKIIYSGDTMISKDLFKVAKGVDLLIHDATFVKAIKGREHSCVKDVAKQAKKAKVKKLVLTHISRRIKTSKEVMNVAKPIFKNVIVAEDLKMIKL